VEESQRGDGVFLGMTNLKHIMSAAVAALAVGALPAVSQAAMQAGGHKTASKTTASHASKKHVPPGSTTSHPAPRFTATSVTAGSTGNGPADDAECDKWASNINDLRGVSQAAALRGDKTNADFYAELAWDYDDQAQDRGCFIVY
jgi:hypothetical protein